MTDYISRDAALNFEMEIEADPDEIDAISKGMALMSEYIKGLPAADVVERKTGKWNGANFHTVECSECGFDIDIMKIDTNTLLHLYHCPNCGARMDGDS